MFPSHRQRPVSKRCLYHIIDGANVGGSIQCYYIILTSAVQNTTIYENISSSLQIFGEMKRCISNFLFAFYHHTRITTFIFASAANFSVCQRQKPTTIIILFVRYCLYHIFCCSKNKMQQNHLNLSSRCLNFIPVQQLGLKMLSEE